MLRSALPGVLAPLLLVAAPAVLGPAWGPAWAPAWADTHLPMLGAVPILPAVFTRAPAAHMQAPRSFTAGLRLGSLQIAVPGSRPAPPARFVVAMAPGAVMRHVNVRLAAAHPAIDPRRLAALVPSPSLWANPAPVQWRAPLFERKLSAHEKALPLSGELIEAMGRIEPIFDPTRLDGPESEVSMIVSAGTATTDSVFGERWHRTFADPNISRKVAAIALAWQPAHALTCTDYVKARAYRLGNPALTPLDAADCRAARAPVPPDRQTPEPIAIAQASVPVFAAPLPGARLSSPDFWAKRKERIAAVQAQLRERQVTEAMKVALSQM